MRYEHEWTAIKSMLPNKPRGMRRVNDRRVLNGIFWVLRSGAPWRDLPRDYNRFVRWRRAGVWDRIMEAFAATQDAAEQHMGRSRGGLTSNIHAIVDANGLPVQLALTPGEAHDNRLCAQLLTGLQPKTMLLADRGYDADWIRALVTQQDAWAN